VSQAGLIAPGHVLTAAVLSFALAALASWALIERGGTPIAVIAAVSIACGFLYTAGPAPLGYIGLGELFVFIFFGIVAVAGTYYVQSFELNNAVLLAGFAPGLLSSAILCVNNLRDIDSDRASQKNTLAVRFGRSFAQMEYVFCVLMACLMPVVIYLYIYDHLYILYASFTGLLAVRGMRTVFTKEDGPSLNHTLAFTGKLLMLYSVLFSIGWIL
jgi:1,4-dihydroxy-2-naphthoate octaprenyltransferase